MRKEENIFYNEKCALDAYLPSADGFTTVVYFHGGLVEGDKADESHRQLTESFAKAGYAFVSVNYRMYTDGAKSSEFLEGGANAVALA